MVEFCKKGYKPENVVEAFRENDEIFENTVILNWLKKNKDLPVHRIEMRDWADDYERVIKLKELFEFHRPNFIKKKHKIEVNELFKKYE